MNCQLLLCLASALFVCVWFNSPETNGQSPPTPPDGFKWVKNEAFSDEFNGTELDSEKWHDHNPYWKGRPPGKFTPSSVSVQDGSLQIKSTVLLPADGKFTVACGAVQSKAQDALFGYYECRMKASSISTSSTFWLTCIPQKVEGGKKKTELDIQECIGNAQRFKGFKTQMRSNTHVTFWADDKAEGKIVKKGDAAEPKVAKPKVTKPQVTKPQVTKQGGQTELASNVADDFHTYGCWWVDANTLKFYADGVYAFTINPPTDLDETPYDLPLFMNLVCETYAWEVPPTIEDLKDDTRNTTYYDYVRAYSLVKESE